MMIRRICYIWQSFSETFTPYISYVPNKRLQREEKLHSKNYLLKMPRSHAKMRVKSAPQKLTFLMTNVI